MKPTRRDFLLTMGAGAAAIGLAEGQDVFWAPETDEDLGWAPEAEERVRSTCLLCPARCGIRARIVDGNLVGISGNALHPMSRGGVCPRGIAGVQMLYHPDRIRSPLVREGPRGSDEWREATPEEAIGIIGDRLGTLRSEGRPEALALLAGYCQGSVEDLWQQFLRAYGSPNYVNEGYDDGTASVMSVMHGIDRRPGYDLEGADFVLSFGAPMFESWWSPLQAFVAYGGPDVDDARRPRFVQVDTRFSRTAARSQAWVGVRPGTHAVLALGIAYVLLRDELFDAAYVAERVAGFEDFVEGGQRYEGYRSVVMRNYRTEEVATVTGVPVERITDLARALAASEAPVVVLGHDVMMSPHGLLAGMAVHSLNVLLGRISRPGGVLVGEPVPLDPLADPVLDAVGRAGLGRPAVAGEAPAFGPGDVSLRFANAVATDSGSAIDTLMMYYANPLESSPRSDVWRTALSKVPFIVSFSPFLDETARQADVILPDLLPYERWQDGTTPASYPFPVWGIGRPLVIPGPDGMHTADAILALARHLGGAVGQSLPYATFEQVLQVRARGLFATRHGMILGNEFERRHQRQMEERGWWLPEHADFDAFWQDAVERGGWMDLFHDDTDPARTAETPSGRIELMPRSLRQALEASAANRSLYITVAAAPTVPSEDFPLRLLPYRVSTLASGTLPLQRWMAEAPSPLPNVLWHPWVEVHPETAEEFGLHEEQEVWVVSPRGRYRARVVVYHGTARENVGAPYGVKHADGELANPLQLLDVSADPLTGLQSWFTTFIRLEPV